MQLASRSPQFIIHLWQLFQVTSTRFMAIVPYLVLHTCRLIEYFFLLNQCLDQASTVQFRHTLSNSATHSVYQPSFYYHLGHNILELRLLLIYQCILGAGHGAQQVRHSVLVQLQRRFILNTYLVKFRD